MGLTHTRPNYTHVRLVVAIIDITETWLLTKYTGAQSSGAVCGPGESCPLSATGEITIIYCTMHITGCAGVLNSVTLRFPYIPVKSEVSK